MRRARDNKMLAFATPLLLPRPQTMAVPPPIDS